MATHPEDRPDPINAVALLDEPTRRRLYDWSRRRTRRWAATRRPGRSGSAASWRRSTSTGSRTPGCSRRCSSGSGRDAGPAPGRPAKLYRRAARDISIALPPRDYRRAAEILEDAIAGVDGSAVTDAIAASARATGRAAGAAARTATGVRAGRSRRREALVDLLRDGGYEPATDPATGSVRLRNCPYHDLAQRHRDVTCGMNLAWASGVVEGLGLAGVEPVLAPEPGTCCVVFADAAE